MRSLFPLGCPRAQYLDPCAFVYINDFPVIVDSQCRLFANDVLVYVKREQAGDLQKDLEVL